MRRRNGVFGKTTAHAAAHLVAQLELRNTLAKRSDHTGGLVAAEFFVATVHDATDHQFAAIQGRGVHLQLNFAGGRLRHRYITPFKYGLMVFGNNPA
jgi:hypothetical protein